MKKINYLNDENILPLSRPLNDLVHLRGGQTLGKGLANQNGREGHARSNLT